MRKTLRLRSFVLLVAVVVSATAIANEVVDRASQRGHFIAAVPDALPQSGWDAAGNLAGFDIAVSEALGEQLGLDVQFAFPSWQEILDGRWHGLWGYAVVSMTSTAEREHA